MMPFRRSMAKRPINSIKNVFDTSGVLPAGVNTIIGTLVDTLEYGNPTDGKSQVIKGSNVNGVYLSMFFSLDANQAGAGSVPLMDWYIIKNRNASLGTSFSAVNAEFLPFPGDTGGNASKSNIFHEEKGLIGEKNDGSKMVFQGVIKIPKGFRSFNAKDQILIAARSNFDVVFCIKCIYRWYS